MDADEATRVVFARLQSLDPENARKVMGFLLLQEIGEEDVIRLACGLETHLLALVARAREELSLSAASRASFLLRQNSASGLLSPSWHAPAAELVSLKNVNAPPFYGAGDLADEFHLADRSASPNGDPAGFHYGLEWGVNGFHHSRSGYAATDFRLGETPVASAGSRASTSREATARMALLASSSTDSRRTRRRRWPPRWTPRSSSGRSCY